MDYHITVEAGDSTEGEAALAAGLVAYNAAHAGPENYRGLCILAHDGEGAIVGGVSGEMTWDWLFVKRLWVSEGRRGQGLGRSLMAAAEREALACGCTKTYLDTFSFQARGFYERLGYEVFGQLDAYPPGHTRYFLQKRDLKGR